MLKKLASHVKQYKLSAILTPVCAAAEVVMEVLIPLVMAELINQGIKGADMNALMKYGLIMMALSLVSLFFGVACAHLASHASSGFGANLRDAMYTNVQRFSFANIDKFSTAGLVTRMTTDVMNIQNSFQMITRIAVRSPLSLIFSLVAAVKVSGELSLIFLGAIVVLAIALSFIIRAASGLFSQVFKKYDALNASVQENVGAIRVVKAFVREEHEKQKFQKASRGVYDLFVKAEKIIALNGPIMNLVVYTVTILLAWFGAHMVVETELGMRIGLEEGDLTAMFDYVMRILMNLMMLSMIFVSLTMSAAAGKRIVEVLDEEPSLTNPEEPVHDVADGSIDFNNVSFTYHAEGSGDDILEDIDLHIRSGETVGIIGGTGCGKSSLVNLISRLYDVKDGSVCVGGVDVRRYDMEALRNQVAVVLQKNVLFSGTILDNLRWGKEDATLEECREACRQACADEFIERMPDKYDTFIEQGGTNVSGGQKQRLCIARALLKKPRVLILDDSTSAVDTATDAKIRKAFAEAIPGTTKLIIAQRVASVQDADRIIVMEDGRIAAFDTHEKLLETCEIYREIYETQTSGSGDFDETNSDEDVKAYDPNREAESRKPGMPPFPPMGSMKPGKKPGRKEARAK
ncbi:MAG: ABC transporter ATP-binding protein [Clostridiales bacterium]|nr:ABC transporter ATP-binding protein [Clostridiales bacterium]